MLKKVIKETKVFNFYLIEKALLFRLRNKMPLLRSHIYKYEIRHAFSFYFLLFILEKESRLRKDES